MGVATVTAAARPAARTNSRPAAAASGRPNTGAETNSWRAAACARRAAARAPSLIVLDEM
jgi:hypothetical protein